MSETVKLGCSNLTTGLHQLDTDHDSAIFVACTQTSKQPHSWQARLSCVVRSGMLEAHSLSFGQALLYRLTSHDRLGQLEASPDAIHCEVIQGQLEELQRTLLSPVCEKISPKQENAFPRLLIFPNTASAASNATLSAGTSVLSSAITFSFFLMCYIVLHYRLPSSTGLSIR